MPFARRLDCRCQMKESSLMTLVPIYRIQERSAAAQKLNTCSRPVSCLIYIYIDQFGIDGGTFVCTVGGRKLRRDFLLLMERMPPTQLKDSSC